MAKAKTKTATDVSVPRLKVFYRDQLVAKLKEEFSFKTVMQVPKIEKIVVSMGLGDALKNKKVMESAIDELSIITGQKAVKTRAKKSIANFKVREGQETGAMVTLRGDIMYEFLDRLISVALPRVKDFRGVKNNAFDGNGNFSLGIVEQIVFPEIDYDKIEKVNGLNVAIVTTAKNDKEGHSLLKGLGMPFAKR